MIKYEVPEMSHRLGGFITAETLEIAQALALENGCDAVWEVEGPFCIGTGKIWVHGLLGWREIDANEFDSSTCCNSNLH